MDLAQLHFEQGFSTRTLASLQQEISFTTDSFPDIRIAWEGWNMPGMESYSFNAMMNGVLHASEQ